MPMIFGIDFIYRSVYKMLMNETDSDTRRIILAGALELFSKRGYEAVGVQEIVDTAGITKPTLYYHFGSKEGLFRALAEEEYARFNDAIRKAAVYVPHPTEYEKDILPALVALSLAYYRYATAHGQFYRMQMALSFAPPESEVGSIVRSMNAAQYTIVASMFAAIGQQHGNVRGKEQMLAALFIGLINTRIALFYGGHGSLTERTARETARLFMHGMFA